MKKANTENWSDQRTKTYSKRTAKIQQKTIEKTADIESEKALVSARVQLMLLKKLEKEVASLPDLMGSQTRDTFTENGFDARKKVKTARNVMREYSLRDFAAVWKDLTSALPRGENESETLKEARRLLEEIDSGF